LKLREDPAGGRYWKWSFDKRPTRELYDVRSDPDCLRNLAEVPKFAPVRDSMAEQLWRELGEQKDPRVTGGFPLDQNPSAETDLRDFHRRFLAKEIGVASWVNASDIQEP
jgi:N-sulfoglucosamine sulfohydrolase